ncbi:MAG: hypothetical protein IT210_08810 [Armatimonadetes bacterium]|nr:hypothetical protein [Armatimonadota bacterium]
MMEAVKIRGKITEDGHLEVTEPVAMSPGEVEIILLKTTVPPRPVSKEKNALEVLKEYDFIGVWQDREDMADSVKWVQELRQRENMRSYHVRSDD